MTKIESTKKWLNRNMTNRKYKWNINKHEINWKYKRNWTAYIKSNRVKWNSKNYPKKTSNSYGKTFSLN